MNLVSFQIWKNGNTHQNKNKISILRLTVTLILAVVNTLSTTEVRFACRSRTPVLPVSGVSCTFQAKPPFGVTTTLAVGMMVGSKEDTVSVSGASPVAET